MGVGSGIQVLSVYLDFVETRGRPGQSSAAAVNTIPSVQSSFAQADTS